MNNEKWSSCNHYWSSISYIFNNSFTDFCVLQKGLFEFAIHCQKVLKSYLYWILYFFLWHSDFFFFKGFKWIFIRCFQTSISCLLQPKALSFPRVLWKIPVAAKASDVLPVKIAGGWKRSRKESFIEVRVRGRDQICDLYVELICFIFLTDKQGRDPCKRWGI